MIIADEADTFARAVSSLLDDADRRRHLGERALQAVSAHYDWSRLIPRLLGAYKEIGVE